MDSKIKKGLYLALATAAFSGVANFVNQFTVRYIGDALVFTTIKNSLVALLIISVLIIFKKLSEIKRLNLKDIGLLLSIGVIGGSLPFYLFFSALAQIPAINASLIHKSLVIWVALLAVPFLKERFSKLQLLAIMTVFGANLVVGGFKGFAFNRPEFFVLAATILWSIENVIAKITLRRVDPDIVIASRMGIGSAILVMTVVILGKGQMLFSLKPDQFALTFLTTLLLFGYVSTWYRALRLTPITLVATVLTLATLVTNGLSAVFVTHKLTINQITQFILLIAGSILFINAISKFPSSSIKKLASKRATT